MTGKLIVIEGIDASGKGTQIKNVSELLTKNHIKFSTYKFPDLSSVYGKIINKFLSSNLDLPKDELIMLYLADMLNKRDKINDDLNNKDIVLLDRYFTSTIAYQSEDKDDIHKIKSMVNLINLRKPDLIIFLDISVNTSLNRKKVRDKLEKDAKFLSRVRKNYMNMINSGYPSKWVKINGDLERDTVTYKILEMINKLYGR